jgi:hypothetical protein
MLLLKNSHLAMAKSHLYKPNVPFPHFERYLIFTFWPTCDAYISLVTLKSHSYIHKLMIE